MFSNQPQLIEYLKSSLQLATLHHQRLLLVLAGDASLQTDTVLETYRQTATNVNPVTIMHVPDRHSNSDITDQINSLLGSEYPCLVFDAHVHFNERLFAASAATVVAGGLFILKTPALDKWSRSSGFYHRFIHKLMHASVQCFPNAEPVSPDSAIFIGPTNTTKKNNRKQTNNHSHKNDGWRTEQQQLIHRLQSALQREGSSVVVVQGDRGRGKSALIGRALAGFDHPAPSITITANRASSCKILIAHANQHLDFVPVDVALQNRHDLLIVEEAGSLPIAVLIQLIQLSHKIVFATTVQGYEGAGRGFAIRFAKQLDTLQPNWLKLTPQEPIRWSANDPMEAFVNDALILNATTPSLTFSAQEHSTHTTPPPIADKIRAEHKNLPPNYPDKIDALDSSVRLISKEELLNDDELLQRIFGLLISAHYQTTPSDLRHMLDEPQLRVYAQIYKGEITGALLLAIEGDIDATLHESIIKKQRRIADHVLPQVFAQASGLSNVLTPAYARIVRIAIHPDLHRQGLGRQLFTQLMQSLRSDSFIGASFGADEASLSFWLSLGCRPVHYGFKINPRSGQRAVCVLFNEDTQYRQTIEFAASILRLNVQALSSINISTDPVLTLLIQATLTSDSNDGVTSLSSTESWALIDNYVQGYRSFTDTVGLLTTHKKIVDQPKVLERVQDILQKLDKLTPKERRETDSELRQLIRTQFAHST